MEKEFKEFPIKLATNFVLFTNGADASYWYHLIQGRDKLKLTYNPTPYMRWLHQVQDYETIPETGNMVSYFDLDYCINLSSSPNSIRWLILVDYKNRPTKLLDHCIPESRFLISSDAVEKTGLTEEKLREVIKILTKERIVSWVPKQSVFNKENLQTIKSLREEVKLLKHRITRMNIENNERELDPNSDTKRITSEVHKAYDSVLTKAYGDKKNV